VRIINFPAKNWGSSSSGRGPISTGLYIGIKSLIIIIIMCWSIESQSHWVHGTLPPPQKSQRLLIVFGRIQKLVLGESGGCGGGAMPLTHTSTVRLA